MASLNEKYGPWALITGASAGLGELFAQKLAAQGLNLILVARRKEKLDTLGERLSKEFGIETRSIGVDLGDAEFMQAIEANTSDIEVGLLVNNAGFTNSGDFLDNSLDKELLLVNVNVRATMVLAHHFGQLMRDRKSGGIIFSASIAGFAAIPFWANYSASKSYDLILSEALAEELRPHNVDVLALCPGATHTEFSTYSGIFAPMMAMQPERVVNQALAKLGKRHTTVVGVLNFLTVNIYRLVPRRVASYLAGRVIRDMVDH